MQRVICVWCFCYFLNREEKILVRISWILRAIWCTIKIEKRVGAE